MRPGPYTELSMLAERAGCTRASLVEGMIHAAAAEAGLDVDFSAERDAIRERRARADTEQRELEAALGAVYFSGVISL